MSKRRATQCPICLEKRTNLFITPSIQVNVIVIIIVIMIFKPGRGSKLKLQPRLWGMIRAEPGGGGTYSLL